LPPSLDILEKRLRERASDTEKVITLPLENAKKEIDFARTHGKYEYQSSMITLKKRQMNSAPFSEFHDIYCGSILIRTSMFLEIPKDSPLSSNPDKAFRIAETLFAFTKN
jgi:hypothetical protein